MQYFKHGIITLVLALLLVVMGCKNSTQTTDDNKDSLSDPLKNMQGEEVIAVQHNFPPTPLEIKIDTSFSIDNKKYGYQSVQKTIDTSMVVFVHKAMGKTVKDVYFDFEYHIKPTGKGYKGGAFILTKHTFKEEFTEDFINHSILHKMEFLGYNIYSNEYEYKFYITQPDTDYSYIIYYFINNKGETNFHVDDV